MKSIKYIIIILGILVMTLNLNTAEKMTITEEGIYIENISNLQNFFYFCNY